MNFELKQGIFQVGQLYVRSWLNHEYDMPGLFDPMGSLRIRLSTSQ
jgi:hypothetical protein